MVKMAPVVPSSMSNAKPSSGIQLIPETSNHHIRFHYTRNSKKRAVSFQNFAVPHSASVKLFSTYRTWSALQPVSRVPVVAAFEDDVAFEEPASAVAREVAEVPSAVVIKETPSYTSDARVKPNVKSKGRRPPRKSVMPPVKNEDLVPGATVMGKVRSIQPFGAFVDIGAFTEGLIHISNLSDNFVTDVKNIVSVGQEVKVRVVEANFETGRISLTMRESNDTGDLQQQEDSSSGTNSIKQTPAKKNAVKSKQKNSKLVKGQELDGTVKKLVRAGSFISLPEGEAGFLPTSEESVEGGANIMEGSSLQLGQEVRVRVLHVTKGRVTLTMKREENLEKLNPEVINIGVVHEGTKPFVYAFLKMLDERNKVH